MTAARPSARVRRALGGSAGALGFVLSIAIAIALYPVDASGRGYSFFLDYWCDLFDPTTPGGVPNPGSWWAVVGMASAGLGLVPLFWSMGSALRGTARAFGLIGCLGVVTVPAVTALGLLDLHRQLILVTGPPGLVGLILAIVVQRQRGEFASARAGYVLLALGGWNFVQYARQAVFETSRWSGLPAVQKAATAALFVWLLVSLWWPSERDVGK